MSVSIERERILDEIQRIPEDKLVEVYAILHYFRVGIEASRTKGSVMRYAGSWDNMPEETFAKFMQGTSARRQQAFMGRRSHEAGVD